MEMKDMCTEKPVCVGLIMNVQETNASFLSIWTISSKILRVFGNTQLSFQNFKRCWKHSLGNDKLCHAIHTIFRFF